MENSELGREKGEFFHYSNFIIPNSQMGC